MTAPFRICRPLSKAQRTALPSTPSPDAYGARLLKLIPAEVIALYLAGRGVIGADSLPVAGLAPDVALSVWALLGLVAVVALRAWGTGDRSAGEGPQWTGVAIAAISYTIWIYSLGDVSARLGIHDPKLGALLVLGWTFTVPLFYRGTRPSVEVVPSG